MKTQFLVTFDGAADTRWHDCQQHVTSALQDYLHSFGKVMTRGAIPCVTVSVYHGTEPAGRHESANESAQAHHLNHGTDGVSSVLSLPTPSRDLICPQSDNPKAPTESSGA